jgi:cellulose synthase/poly-beta-1,6-N-acetylglucosamine synthase-like glycosyltransferase
MNDTALFGADHCARRDLRWCRILLALSIALGLAALADLVIAVAAEVRVERWAALEGFAFLLACLVLLFGGIVHQLARLGLAQRRATEPSPGPAVAAPPAHDRAAPLVSILVPAYKEESDVVLRTLLSAALQTHPRRRVVLLLDDPPHPPELVDRYRLAATRAMPERIAELLAPLRHWIDAERAAFGARLASSTAARKTAALTALADGISFWFDSLSDAWAGGDHEQRFFAEAVLRRSGRLLRERAREAAARADADAAAWQEILAAEYDRIAAPVRVEVQVFERKRFVNLSHAANKAMNLNSYIACMGKRLVEREVDGTLHLVEAADGAVLAPASPYLITLDADSILLPEYAERLIAEMERPGNERLAVL